jgi:hypothetical protein
MSPRSVHPFRIACLMAACLVRQLQAAPRPCTIKLRGDWQVLDLRTLAAKPAPKLE